MGQAASRNGKIDFLRFLFSVTIVLNHAKYFAPKGALQDTFKGFSFAVEFFFLVSGYLMMASIEKTEANGNRLSLGRETGLFIFRKFKSVYPEIAVAYGIALIATSLATTTSVVELFVASWSEVFLITSTGLKFQVLNSVTWYISSMLLCMCFLYPLIRKHKSIAVRIVLPVLALLVLGFLKQNLGTPRDPSQWLGFTFRGNLRAAAELSLGVMCYFVTKKLKKINFTVFGRILLTVLEFGIYFLYLRYMYTVTSSLKDYFYLFLLCVAVCISFSQQGIEARLFNNRFCSFLGKYSLSLYLGHRFYPEYWDQLFPFLADWRFRYQFLFYIVLSFATGFLILLISAILRKYGGRLLALGKKMVVKAA